MGFRGQTKDKLMLDETEAYMPDQIEKFRELERNATPRPWISHQVRDEEWQETYYGIQTADGRPIGTFDGDNAVWLKEGQAVANRDLVVLLRNLAPEILAILRIEDEDTILSVVDALKAKVRNTSDLTKTEV